VIKLLGIIVVGHGKFGKGLIDSVNLISGENEYIDYVEFKLEDSPDILEENIKLSVKKMHEYDGILFLTDISGGTPFKTCVLMSQEIENSEVIAGTNLPMLLDVVMKQDTDDINMLKKDIMETGKQGITSFDL